jgi:arginase
MIQLIGIPYDGGSSFLKGPAYAPPRIRLMAEDGSANNYAENLAEISKNKNYNDRGDIVFDSLNPESVYNQIKSTITEILTHSDPVLSLGGDHSISFPIIEAHSQYYQDLHILHLDAHADLYENFEDNPYSHASPFARIMERGLIKSLTQVGIRTLNPHQKEQAEKFGVKIIPMNQLILDFLQDLQGPLYLSLDLDVLDPAFAPGVSHHEPGGISTRELIHIIQSIPVPIVGADIVEYNPMRDVNNMTAMVAYKLMKEIMAKMM